VAVEFDRIRASMLQTLLGDIASLAEHLAGDLAQLAAGQPPLPEGSGIREASNRAEVILRRLDVATRLGTIDKMLRSSQGRA
jgi:hypothetical protein